MHFKAPDIGLDLGTCNTVVYVKNEGIVISEPTLVISRRGDKKPIAVGEDAQRMYGRTSDAEIAIHPIRNGMIANSTQRCCFCVLSSARQLAKATSSSRGWSCPFRRKLTK